MITAWDKKSIHFKTDSTVYENEKTCSAMPSVSADDCRIWNEKHFHLRADLSHYLVNVYEHVRPCSHKEIGLFWHVFIFGAQQPYSPRRFPDITCQSKHSSSIYIHPLWLFMLFVSPAEILNCGCSIFQKSTPTWQTLMITKLPGIKMTWTGPRPSSTPQSSCVDLFDMKCNKGVGEPARLRRRPVHGGKSPAVAARSDPGLLLHVLPPFTLTCCPVNKGSSLPPQKIELKCSSTNASLECECLKLPFLCPCHIPIFAC